MTTILYTLCGFHEWDTTLMYSGVMHLFHSFVNIQPKLTAALLHGWGVLVWMCNPPSEVQCLSPRSCVSCRFIKQTCKAYILLHLNPCQVARPLPPQSNQPTTFEGIFLTYSLQSERKITFQDCSEGHGQKDGILSSALGGGGLGVLETNHPNGLSFVGLSLGASWLSACTLIEEMSSETG